MLSALLDWLDHRTGHRAILHVLLDERLPKGTGWFFTLGSVVMVLLGIQLATGAVLTMYYVATPDHAWDSVQYISTEVTFGRVLRNLHFYGASFIVVAAGAHMLRVFAFGSYKRPRELTWISGLVLLLVILGFSLTGYLLPWDQRAYWATVVTLNIARIAPGAGEFLASVLRGGQELGALTLSRWYSLHVIFLPAGLLALVATHLYLMRRHEISGPIAARPGEGPIFFPQHVIKDATVAGAVFVGLFAMAVFGGHQSEPVANPEDATYVPRPEWYFLWLFQMLKYFPGDLEVVGAHLIPGLLVASLLLLPFLDTHPERRPWKRPIVSGLGLLVLAAIATLTSLGLRDVPSNEGKPWGPLELGGQLVADSQACVRCHERGGIAPPFSTIRIRKDDGWLRAHAEDPEVIAPGVRKPPAFLQEQQIRAVLAFLTERRRGTSPPPMPADEATVKGLLGAYCLGCHKIDGEGAGTSPNLTHAGRERDAAWLAAWIADPESFEPGTDMPPFRERLSAAQIKLVADYLATRK
ncbi:MAG: cytochrome b N-terminal domain-containing protein [Vicinamibacterales bacterium]